jgi:hypothetical protein
MHLTQNGILPPYMAFPRFLLETNVNDTARIVYMLLLDRSRISQKNEGWQDDSGAVFVIFPIAHLAQAIHRSATSIKTALSALEREGLIFRQRQGTGRANRIFVRFPRGSFQTVTGVEIQPPDGQNSVHPTASKLSTNNKYHKNIKFINKQGERSSSYGKYQNVYLTEQDIEDLRETVPDYRKYIESLSAYMASTGKKYKNHAATIKRWADREAAEHKKKDYRERYYNFKEGDSL